MTEQNEGLLLTDEEFLEWCGEHKVIGCGGSREMEGVDRTVSICEDCRAQAQLAKAKPIIEKQERENTISKINKSLEPAKLTVCAITMDGCPELTEYGLADKHGDEIDVALLRGDE